MKNARDHKATLKLSKKFGINYESYLLKLNFFDVCKCLLQEQMHVIYEGIGHDELGSLFNYIIKKNQP